MDEFSLIKIIQSLIVNLCCTKHGIKKITGWTGLGIFEPYILEETPVGVYTSYHRPCSKIPKILNVIEWIELFHRITD